MKKKQEKQKIERPSLEQMERAIARQQYRQKYYVALRGTIGMLIVVAAVAVICANYFFAVLRAEGSSMTPLVEEGDLLLVQRTGEFETGDIIAFYYNNKILLKRVIASPGEWVEIDEEGNVSVDGKVLDEPYLSEKSAGEGDLTYPYQVPEGRWFVLGDHRSVSLDSRYSELGNVTVDQVLGKVWFCVWPFSKLGSIQ